MLHVLHVLLLLLWVTLHPMVHHTTMLLLLHVLLVVRLVLLLVVVLATTHLHVLLLLLLRSRQCKHVIAPVCVCVGGGVAHGGGREKHSTAQHNVTIGRPDECVSRDVET